MRQIGHVPEAFNADARAIFEPRQGMRIDGENRSRPRQQGNMEANGREVAKVRADRGQSDFNSAPEQGLKPARKTGARFGAPLGRKPAALVSGLENAYIGDFLASCAV